jgi:hypothetical protein
MVVLISTGASRSSTIFSNGNRFAISAKTLLAIASVSAVPVLIALILVASVEVRWPVVWQITLLRGKYFTIGVLLREMRPDAALVAVFVRGAQRDPSQRTLRISAEGSRAQRTHAHAF